MFAEIIFAMVEKVIQNVPGIAVIAATAFANLTKRLNYAHLIVPVFSFFLTENKK